MSVIPYLKLFNGSSWSREWNETIFLVAVTPWSGLFACFSTQSAYSLLQPPPGACTSSKRLGYICTFVYSTYLTLFFHYHFFLYACSKFHYRAWRLRCLTHRNCCIMWFLKDWLTDRPNEKISMGIPFPLGNQNQNWNPFLDKAYYLPSSSFSYF